MSTISNFNVNFVNPQEILTGPTIDQIRTAAKESIEKALEVLGQAIAGVGGHSHGTDGAPELAPPKSTLMQKVTDMTLKIAVLQQALDELQQMVSKTVLEGRMKEVDQTHKEQLENIEAQMKEMKEAAEKAAEAKKKSGILGAIVNFFMAIVDFFSAVFSFVAAIGNALVGNVVGAAGMFAAAGAQLCSGFCNLVLAADSIAMLTSKDGKGFLSDQAKKDIGNVMIACAVVAGVGGLMGGLGAVTMGLKEAAKAATKGITQAGIQMTASQATKAANIIAKSVMKEVAQKMMNPFAKEITEEGMKKLVESAAKELAKEGIEAFADDAGKAVLETIIKESMKAGQYIMQPMIDFARQMAVTNGVIGGATQIVNGGVGIEINRIKQEAAEHMKEAEEAEAAAKALEAMITLIKKTIEELQAQLGEMLDQAMQTMSILFQCIDDSAQTMTQLHQTQAA